MSRTGITLKFKMRWFPDEASYWAEKFNLPILMPVEDKNFGGSLVLDFRKWWRHMQAKNKLECVYLNEMSLFSNIFPPM